MSARLASLLTVLVVATATFVATAPSALGVFTFSRITTPSKDRIFNYDQTKTLAQNTFTVSGVASTDLSAVNIDCIVSIQVNGEIEGIPMATNVPVTGGKFSTIASYQGAGGPLPTCRLRALPTALDPTDPQAYVAPFTGPILFTNGAFPNKQASTTYGYIAVTGEGTDFGEVASASECSTAAAATFLLPQVTLLGSNQPACSFGLPGSDVTTTGTPDGTAIRVDGHNAFLPAAVHDYLDQSPLSLGLPVPSLSLSVSRPNAKGDIVVTESAPLKRCSVSDVYPPTLVSCPALVNTGVTFKRVSTMFAHDHQIRVRDQFIANGSAHTVSASYTSQIHTPNVGAPGYQIPGHGATFLTPGLGAAFTGLGTKANTIVVRSDKFAAANDTNADTFALTWSRAPQKIQFDGAQRNFFTLPYALHVAANGVARIGFALSERLLTADAIKVAKIALTDMVATPKITSPANGATIHGHSTTVKGTVSLGANGLPTSVTVSGHAATLHVNATKTSATFSVTFSEAFGTHTLVATAKDAAGNTASRSISVKNAP